MRLTQYIKEAKDQQPTKEMIEFFEKRTSDHIKTVQNNIKTIIKNRNDIDKNDLLKRLKDHDQSKYSSKERIPYIWLSWWHKEKNAGRKFEYPEGMKEKVKKAAKSHIVINKHHPQAHSSIDKMSDVDIAEMIADWAAMSQELKDDLKAWTDKSVKRFKFNKEQTKLIYELLELFT